MPSVESSILVYKPQQDIFNLSQNFELRSEWDPFLTEVKYLNNATESAKGVQVKVKARNHLSMIFEYIFLNNPKSTAIQMVSGPFFFKKFAGSTKFTEVNPDVCRIQFRYNFVIKWYYLSFIVSPIVKYVFQKNMDIRLKNFKRVSEQTDILNRMDGEYLDIELD